MSVLYFTIFSVASFVLSFQPVTSEGEPPLVDPSTINTRQLNPATPQYQPQQYAGQPPPYNPMQPQYGQNLPLSPYPPPQQIVNPNPQQIVNPNPQQMVNGNPQNQPQMPPNYADNMQQQMQYGLPSSGVPMMDPNARNPQPQSKAPQYAPQQQQSYNSNPVVPEGLANLMAQMWSLLDNPSTKPAMTQLLNNLEIAFSNPTSLGLLDGLLNRLSQAPHDMKALQDIVNVASIPKTPDYSSFRDILYPGNYIPANLKEQSTSMLQSIFDDIKNNKIGAIIDFTRDLTEAKHRALNKFFGNIPILGPLTRAGTQMSEQGMSMLQNSINPFLSAIIPQSAAVRAG